MSAETPFTQRGAPPQSYTGPSLETEPQVNPVGLPIAGLMTRPETVAIVCLGASSQSFLQESMMNQSFKKPWDEVWTLNRGVRAFRHDKLFVMDDLRWIEQESPDYANYLKNLDVPLITSTAYKEYPTALAYPLETVLQVIGDDIFCVNTVSYMVAYAMTIGVKVISIYGADFFYANGNTAESGGQAVAYLLGRCQALGIEFRIPNQSTLLYAHLVQQTARGVGRRLYGYHRKDELEKAAKTQETRKALKEVQFYA